ncbi:MAG: DUF2341 domain-containing protein [Thiobacillus sp.]
MKRPDPRPTRALIEELEPRLLYSADFAPTLADSLILGAEERVIGGDGEYATTMNSQQDAQHARFEVVFIDLRVEGYQQILDDIREQNGDGRSIEVILLDSERDGIEQIGDFLNTRQEIDAIHIISHGGAGSVQLGSGQLDFDSMIKNASAIKQWGNALSSEADILIYGCDLASSQEGLSLVDALSKLTGADVAASDDKTGAAELGGDYDLEYVTGTIEGKIVFSSQLQQNWQYVLPNLPPVAGNDSAATTENSILTVSAPGVLANDTDPDASATAGYTLNFNAANDGDSVWTDDTPTTGFDWTLTNFGTQSTYTTTPGSAYPGITAAYRFSGTNSGATMPTMEGMSGDPTNNSASFEIWFRTDVLNETSGQHIIFEAGGVNSGTSIYLDNTFLKFATRTSGAAADEVSVDLATLYASPTAEFIQVIGVIDQTSGQMKLYVDGTLRATKSFSGSNGSDWSGPDGAGLGTVFTDVSSGPAAGSGTLDGDIAIFRLYESALTGTQVSTNFTAVTGTGLTVSQVQGSAGNVGNQIALSSGALLTLNTNGSYTYNPNGQFEYLASGQSTTDNFSYTVADALGATATATVTITINGTNDAPILSDTALTLTVAEDASIPSGAVGSLISAFIGGITDVDSGAVKGIAITATNEANGTWYYSTNNGTNWTTVGTVNASSSLLLANNASTRLYFAPSANYNGTATAALTLRAWDTTSGTAGSKVSTASTGGTTAFSSATDVVDVIVTPVADTPSITNATTNEDIQSTSGLVLSRNAADGTEVTHFKITGITNGTLYQNNGTTQITNGSFITVAQGNAGLKFTPTADFNGSGSFTIQASTSNLDAGLGGSTVSAVITVNAVNDAPSGADKAVTALEDTAYTFTLADFGFTDVDGNSLDRVWFTTLPSQGTLLWNGAAFGAGNFVVASDITSGLLTYIPPSNANGTALTSFTFQVQDNGGTDNGGVNLDPTPKTITLNVTAVNDAPTLNNGATVTLTSTNENTPSTGTLVSSLLTSASWADVDTGAARGIAITSTTGNGAWQYSTNGTNWAGFGTVSSSNALLITLTTQVRYVPDGLNGETATFAFRAWDQTTGAASTNAVPRYANPGVGGGTSAYSIGTATASISVSSINDAPTLVGWYDNTWTYRNAISIDHTQVAGNVDLTDFTVLINLSAHADLAAGALSSGNDIRFTSGDGTTLLAYEIETFTSSNGALMAWVKLPTLSAHVDTRIYLYYGNAAATTPVTSSGVWDASTAAVYHLDESTNPYLDSTGNGNNGTSGIYPTATPGQVGGGQSFDGSSTTIVIADSPTLNQSQNVTVSAWVKLDAFGNFDLVEKGGFGGYTLWLKNDVMWFGTQNAVVNTWAVSTTPLSLGVWYAFDGVNNNGINSLYINGVLNASSSIASSFTNTGALQLGNGYDGYLNGILDEVRVDTAARTAGWISTKYNNTASPATFSVVGAQQAGTGATTRLAATDEDTPSAATSVNTILTNVSWADADIGAMKGIAVSAMTGNGTWQYSSDGVNWTAFGAVNSSNALLLDSATDIRYIPDGVNGETATFAFRAWDKTSGSASSSALPSYANPGTGGGTSAYSAQTVTAAMTITDVNDAPVITSNGGGSSAATNMPENSTAVTTVTATDADLPAQTLTYSIVGGVNADKFAIDSSTGALRFISPPDYENPQGGASNNSIIYDVTVGVSDGIATTTQALSIIVWNVNDAPVVTTTGTALGYTENDAATAVDSGLSVSDQDNANLTSATITIGSNYVNGQDILAFTSQLGIIGSWDAAAGVLTLTGSSSVTNYQTALRSVTYVNTSDTPSPLARTVTFAVRDNALWSVAASCNINVTPVDDPAVIGGTLSYSGNEGDTVSGTMTATDVDGLTDGTYFSVTGAASFGTAAINAATGAWTFTPTDRNWFGSDAFTVTVTDDLGGTTTQVVSITLANVDDAAVIGGAISYSSYEGDVVGGTMTATDVDGLTDGTYFSVTGAASFGTAAINAATGAWTFTATDANWFGPDSFTVTVTDDQGGITTQIINIMLSPVNYLDEAASPVLIGIDPVDPPNSAVPASQPDAEPGDPAAAETAAVDTKDLLMGESALAVANTLIGVADSGPDIRLKANELRFYNELFRIHQEFGNAETREGILQRLLDLIQAEGASGSSGQNTISPTIRVEISQEDGFQVEVLRQGAQITAVSLSVGAVWWALRVGGLFASLLTSLPAWRSFDMLPVLSRDKDDDENETDWALNTEVDKQTADASKRLLEETS